ncbi:MAG: HAMP domain-containing histidine kinase [Campylobacterales bacterium]|nr:HAMP domain-containing histidine kinase [Campylobacterales bacterium]
MMRFWTLFTNPLIARERHTRRVAYFLALVFYFTAISTYAYHNYQKAKEELMERIDSALKLGAQSIEVLLPVDFHDRATNENAITVKEDLANIKQLSDYVKLTSLQYIYSCIKVGDMVHFTSCSATDEEFHTGEGLVLFFDPYQDAAPELHKALQSGQTMFAEYTDQWGSFRSIFIPKKTDNGTVYLLAADIRIDFVQEELKKVLLRSLFELGFYTFILFPFILLYIMQNQSIKRELALEVEARTNELYRLQQEQLLRNQLLLQQSKMAAIGEMISMIAHQWRQPLGAINATILDMKIKFEMEHFNLEDAMERDLCLEYFKASIDDMGDFTKILSTTIDDFRNFYKLQRKAQEAHIEEPVVKALKIMNCYMLQGSIDVQEQYASSSTLNLFISEIMHVIISILRNAQENFQIKQTPNPRIRIRSYEDEQSVVLEFCDNGGGIPEAFLNQIFDPYFTTKGANEGTGLGLYMSKTIIEVHHEGKMSAKNSDDGVCFVIQIPKRRIS